MLQRIPAPYRLLQVQHPDNADPTASNACHGIPAGAPTGASSKESAVLQGSRASVRRLSDAFVSGCPVFGLFFARNVEGMCWHRDAGRRRFRRMVWLGAGTRWLSSRRSGLAGWPGETPEPGSASDGAHQGLNHCPQAVSALIRHVMPKRAYERRAGGELPLHAPLAGHATFRAAGRPVREPGLLSSLRGRVGPCMR